MNAKRICCAAVSGLFSLGALAGHAGAAAPSPAEIMTGYESLAHLVFSQALQKANDLDKAVDGLLANPNAQTLAAARDAWKASRPAYQLSEGFRFGNKIVDDWEGRVNSWPLDEGLIDYVDKTTYGETKDENPAYTADIIAHPNVTLGKDMLDAAKIDKALIKSLTKFMEVDANVGTGYHAIEFLLWGQDLNGTRPGAGNRPATDFDLKSCTGGNCDRRRDYLKAATSLLIDDLKEMTDNWTADGAARAQLAAKSDSEQLATILTGLGSLSYGELAGERMKLGVLLHDPEEEQDCFSDNTHNAHYWDVQGIIGIWNGEYRGDKKASFPSIAALAREKAPEAAKRVDDAFASTLAKVQAMKDKAETGGMAYDQMLASGNVEGNKLVLDAVDALIAQTRAIEAVVAALGLTVKVEGSDSLDSASAAGGK
jgi:putative iron-regulated protein